MRWTSRTPYPRDVTTTLLVVAGLFLTALGVWVAVQANKIALSKDNSDAKTVAAWLAALENREANVASRERALDERAKGLDARSAELDRRAARSSVRSRVEVTDEASVAEVAEVAVSTVPGKLEEG